jgi:hypothetical protein
MHKVIAGAMLSTGLLAKHSLSLFDMQIYISRSSIGIYIFIGCEFPFLIPFTIFYS